MFKKIRYYYWITSSFVKRHVSLIVKSTIYTIILATLAIVLARYIPATRTLTRVGLVGKYTPETLPVNIQRKISQGLISIDDEGDPMPELAKSWEVSEDNLTYTFELSDKIEWHDGKSLTADDINYNFKEVEVEKSGNTIKFKLEEPFAPFFQAVSRPILRDGRIGTGEFQLYKSDLQNGVLQQVTLLSETEKYIYKFYPTESAAITAFQLGEVDKLENISYVPDLINSDPSIKVTGDPNVKRIVVLFFNNNDSTLSSKATRQGLAYAIRDKTFGNTRALSPIDQDSWGYNDLVKDYNYDQTKADTLFYTDQNKEEKPPIELKTTLAYLDIAETIASDWRTTLGIEVNVKVVTNLNSDFQALLTDYDTPIDPDQYTIWHSTQATNFTHYSNLKVDKLLEDGRRTLDRKQRTEIYQDFQRFLLEDCPAVFLYNTSGYIISR